MRSDRVSRLCCRHLVQARLGLLVGLCFAASIGPDASADERPRQVLIAASIAEVSRTDIADIGLDLDSLSQLTRLPSGIGDGTIPENVRIRGLGSPSLTVIDGQAARIGAIESIPIPAAGVADPVLLPVGLELDIVPMIQPDGYITITIDSRVAMPSFEQGVPSRATRTIDTSLQVRSGQTVAIGGLFTDTDRATAARIPAFGDVPILGPMFRSQQFQRGESDLLIFITPTTYLGDEDTPGGAISVSFSGGGGYGEIDRGDLQLPIRVELNSQFQEAPEFDTSGTSFYSARLGVDIDLGTVAGDSFFAGQKLGTYFSYGVSEFDGFDNFLAGGDVNPFMDGSVLLDPGGLGGGLGGGGIKLVDNGIGFADHTDIRASSDYQELRFGLNLGRTYALGGGTLTPRGGFYYGRTEDDSAFSGITGNGIVDYRYDNEITSDRVGFEVSVDAAIPVTRGVEFYVRPQIEVSRAFADASSAVQVDVSGAPFGASSVDGIEHSFTSFGYSAAAGVRIGVTPNLTLDVGGLYESWEGTMLEFEPEEEVKIGTPRRNSWTLTAGVNLRF